MAAPNPGVWGIDLGQCGLKALRLENVDGTIMATAFDYVEHPKILSQPDADPDQLTREALAKFMSRNTLRGDQVAISVPGQSGLARFVKLPPVEEKKIGDIVRFEAKQQIPFNLDEVVWDYQKIGSGTVTDGFALDTEIGLFAIKRDMIARSLQYFKEQNLDVHLVQMAPLALCNFVAFDLLGKGGKDEEEEEANDRRCIVALDTGADSSNLVITDGERIIWQRPIPLGGNHFTRALTKELKLTFAKAEHLKRNATKSPELKKILAALKPVLNDFVGEVQRSLGYFTNTHKDAQVQFMLGLGNAFRLPGLQRYLQEKLQLDVRKMTKLERIGGDSVLNSPVFNENLATFAVAAGLALQGLRQARLITNLLPGEIRMERIVRAKKPWAVAAAAALLLSTSAIAYSYHLEYQAYGHPAVETAVKKSKDVVAKVSSADAAYLAAKAAAAREEAAVKAIVAGQSEHFNWLDLTKFVGDVIPRPDGSNLPKEALGYFTTAPRTEDELQGHPNRKEAMSGADAYKELEKRLAGAKAAGAAAEPAKDDLGRGIDDLIQFNIEAVDCRFCDDLPGFWRTVKERLQESRKGSGYVRPLDHWNKPPEGKGWVVELRGYTYHHKKDRFVIDALVENIARLGIQGAAGGGGGGNANPAGGASPPAAAPNLGPVVNRVSHVVLYNTHYKKNTEGGGFEILGSSALPELVKAGSGTEGAPGGAPGGPAPGALGGSAKPGAGGGRETWTPLTAGGKEGGSGAARPGSDSRKSNVGSTVPGTGVRPGGTGTGKIETTAEGTHFRTEFVVLFVWKENTPSDALRGDAGGEAARR